MWTSSPPGLVTVTLRGGGTDPARAAAAQAQGERAGHRPGQRSRQGFTRPDDPLARPGVPGAVPPFTTPFGLRR